MKKVLLTIISVCLIAASIFGLFAGVSSFSDIMNVKEYKEEDAKEGLEAIETLNDGLDLLQENEGTYLGRRGHLHRRPDRLLRRQDSALRRLRRLLRRQEAARGRQSCLRRQARSRLPTTPRLTMKARPPSPRSSL